MRTAKPPWPRCSAPCCSCWVPPTKAAKALAAHARLAKIVEVNAGHALMTEAPDEVLFALRDFLAE